MRRLPPLSALPAFEATARLGSMKAAGEELGRTHGAISKQIANLAEDIGVPLVEREGTGIRLTPVGQELASFLSGALDQLENVCDGLRLKGNDSLIELGVSATFAMRWLMPRMPRFYQRRPGTEVIFRMAGTNQLRDSEADVILTYDRLHWDYGERDDIRTIGPVAFGAVHAPGFELKGSQGLYKCQTQFVQANNMHAWTAWTALSGVTVEAQTTQTYPHFFLAIEAAIAGLGVLLVERRLVQDDLNTGQLIAPFGFVEIEGGLGAIVTARGRDRRVVAEFLDWIEKEACSPQPSSHGIA